MKMPKLLFYCQHLLGIGHLTRSLAICESLVTDFEVHFIQGGPDVGKTVRHKHFHHHFINPLLMREEDSSLFDPNQVMSISEIFAARRSSIHKILESEKFDVIVTELFPFGRNKFKTEVLQLISAAKQINPHLIAATSVRDILVEKQDSEQREQKIAALIQEYYDLVLVHSDAQIIKLEETFKSAGLFENKIRYTGFVTESAKEETHPQREKSILVSMGGGIVGADMVMAVLECLPKFPDFIFKIATGPYAPSELKNKVSDLSQRHSNLVSVGFLSNFEEELLKCSLSISMAGYNTVMNILNTKTPSLVYPYMANIEQNLRAVELQKKGQLSVFYANDLNPEKLSELISHELNRKRIHFDVNINGSKNTTRILMEAVNEK